jgi:hypothetical protein
VPPTTLSTSPSSLTRACSERQKSKTGRRMRPDPPREVVMEGGREGGKEGGEEDGEGARAEGRFRRVGSAEDGGEGGREGGGEGGGKDARGLRLEGFRRGRTVR